jgi:holo-[acyl-carrier protein] synthase
VELYQGIDLVSVRRLQQAAEAQGARFLNRIFSVSERAYCLPRKMKYEHLAARFAAKEAFIKACTPVTKNPVSRGVALNQIEVRKENGGKPFLHLSPAARKKLGFPARARIELSLAHEREFAVATVVLLCPSKTKRGSR